MTTSDCNAQLEVLPKADLIITMGDGCIQEMGTYNELLESKGAMSKLIADHLSDSQQASPSGGKGDIENAEDIELKKVHLEDEIEAAHDKEEGGGAPKTNVSAQNLTTKEERTTGTLSGSVYLQYAKSMGGLWVSVGCFCLKKHLLTSGFPFPSQKAPIFLGLLLVAQTANVGTTVFLSFWSESSLGWSQGRYMGGESFPPSFCFPTPTVHRSFFLSLRCPRSLLHAPHFLRLPYSVPGRHAILVQPLQRRLLGHHENDCRLARPDPDRTDHLATVQGYHLSR